MLSNTEAEIRQIKAEIASYESLITEHKQTLADLRSKDNTLDVQRQIQSRQTEISRCENYISGLKNRLSW